MEYNNLEINMASLNFSTNDLQAGHEQNHDELGHKLVEETTVSLASNRTAQSKHADAGSMSVKEEGAIANASLSSGWHIADRVNSATNRFLRFTPLHDEQVSISLQNPRIPVDAETASSFQQILSAHANGGYKLSSSEIKALESVMNKLNVGDNQHTNDAKPGDRYAPSFQVNDCSIQQLNERPALVVEGRFINRDGTAGRMFKGAFIDRDGTGEQVQGVAFEASNQEGYFKHINEFDKLLESIKWARK